MNEVLRGLRFVGLVWILCAFAYSIAGLCGLDANPWSTVMWLAGGSFMANVGHR